MAKDASGEQRRAGRNWTEIDLRTFLRVTGWGSAAVAALFLASASVMSGSGMQRLFTASQLDPAPPLTPAELTARAAAADDAIRQLTQSVRRLGAEREQTAARVAALERSLDDVTGSIKSAANMPPAPAQPSLAAPAPDASAGGAAPSSVAAASAASAVTRPNAAAPNAPAPNATAPNTAAPAVEVADTPGARIVADLGIDVGGAVNFEGLRILWTSTREHDPTLFENLFPLVAVRESSKTHAAELRLVIGPIAGTEAAGRICAALSAVRRYCQPVAFEGQRLQVADTMPEHSAAPPPRKRAAAAERKPRTNP